MSPYGETGKEYAGTVRETVADIDTYYDASSANSSGREQRHTGVAGEGRGMRGLRGGPRVRQ